VGAEDDRLLQETGGHIIHRVCELGKSQQGDQRSGLRKNHRKSFLTQPNIQQRTNQGALLRRYIN